MSLMPMLQMQHKLNKELKFMDENEAVEVKTYKKDRGFIIHKLNNDDFRLVEFGYQHLDIVGNQHEIKKQINKTIKREFPRSNQAWVQFFQKVTDPYQLNKRQPQIDLF